MKYIAIVATSKNLAIGKEGKIPWYFPEDFQHFKETTLGSPIIMGRKTFESIGRILPGRENIILSREPYNFPGTISFQDIPSLYKYLKDSEQEKAYICGGAQIYKLFLESGLVDEIVISRIPLDIEGADTYFPEFEGEFQCKKIDQRQRFSIEYWEKKISR